MRAVPLIVSGIPVVIVGVTSKDIVDESISIIVDLVASDFCGIAPHIGGEVLMGRLNARIDNCDNDSAGGGANIPAFGCVDIRIGNLVQPPKCAVEVFWIIGDKNRLANIVRFDRYSARLGGRVLESIRQSLQR